MAYELLSQSRKHNKLANTHANKRANKDGGGRGGGGGGGGNLGEEIFFKKDKRGVRLSGTQEKNTKSL